MHKHAFVPSQAQARFGESGVEEQEVRTLGTPAVHVVGEGTSHVFLAICTPAWCGAAVLAV